MCGFVPLREGTADDPRRWIPLTGDRAVRLLFNQEHTIDPVGLVGVFERPRFETWTGVTYAPMQSIEWLYLWLACVAEPEKQLVIGRGLLGGGDRQLIGRAAPYPYPYPYSNPKNTTSA
jgi:hypothetical protein